MNKISKVVWSKVRNSYIIVSEAAKTNSKGASGVAKMSKLSLFEKL